MFLLAFFVVLMLLVFDYSQAKVLISLYALVPIVVLLLFSVYRIEIMLI